MRSSELEDLQRSAAALETPKGMILISEEEVQKRMRQHLADNWEERAENKDWHKADINNCRDYCEHEDRFDASDYNHVLRRLAAMGREEGAEWVRHNWEEFYEFIDAAYNSY